MACFNGFIKIRNGFEVLAGAEIVASLGVVEVGNKKMRDDDVGRDSGES